MSKVKICGLSRIEDVDAVNRALPDYIGFVFAQSRRQVDERTAYALKQRLDTRIKAVGVFVNDSVDAIVALFRSGVIDLAQLHGDEDDEYIKRLKAACGCLVIKVVGVGEKISPVHTPPVPAHTPSVPASSVGTPAPAPLLPICAPLPVRIPPVCEPLRVRIPPVCAPLSAPLPPICSPLPVCTPHVCAPLPVHLPAEPDYLLFDVLSERRGGIGKAFDWGVLDGYRGLRYFLAGGLSIENVGGAIERLSPYCVDVSSGVETGGRKDPYKIEEFVNIVRRQTNE